jgi:hypothetical protein
MIGHALAPAQRRPATVDWDRWIAAGFALGSVCFFIAATGKVSISQLVDDSKDREQNQRAQRSHP